MSGRRRSVIMPLTVLLVVMVLATGAGCDSDMAKEFRNASGAELEQGVDMLLDGLVDGVFEVWAPDTSTDSAASQ